jgi:hypothetical protein
MSRGPASKLLLLCKTILDGAEAGVCPHVDSFAVCLRKDRQLSNLRNELQAAMTCT